jgi:hypothetical protein
MTSKTLKELVNQFRPSAFRQLVVLTAGTRITTLDL